MLNISKLFSENYTKYYRYAYSLSGNKYLAEDLVMGVFEQIMLKEKEREFSGEVEGYIIRSIRNRYLDHMKLAKPSISLNPEDEYLSDKLRSRDDTLSADNELEDLVEKLEKLGELCRGVLALFGLGYSYEEIADIEAIKLGTVKNRMSTCRERLALEYQL